ncbi:hypothetical protein NLI96_g10223 [Meripilus lineatus]|uniref:Uncharacterized protein n=1 Tax=Meripilus lineatus TaxID=2056292 RepID=A0AAD5UU10_9APHY|nr:hypothetical protein NLI96_g10223 [Physisporinus lineatus]
MQRLTRTLKMSEWATIQRHCHRVKALGTLQHVPVQTDKFCTMDLATSNEFLKYLQSRKSALIAHTPKFLPNLTGLAWPCSWLGIHTLELVPHLLGPTLIHLSVWGHHGDSYIAPRNVLAAMMRILLIVPQCSPSLKRLFYDYSMPEQDNQVSNLLSTVIPKCPLLVEVSSHTIPLSEKAFKHLAGLPSLKLLVSAIPTTGYPETRRSSNPTFPSLRSCKLQAVNMQQIQTLLGSMGSREVDSLAVELNKTAGVTSDQFKSLLDLITQNQSSLRVLHITHATRLALPQPNPDQILSFTDISPMVNKFPNIIQVCLVSSNFAIDLNDDDLRAMALAWPSLRVFQIRCTRPYCPRPSITLQSFLTFATYCPDLTHLILNLDPSPPNDYLRRQGKEARHRRHTLQYLQIFVWNELEFPSLLADFILDLFPNVTVHAEPICPREGNRKLWLEWETFQPFMRGFVAARRNTGRERLTEVNRDETMQTDE